MYWQIGLQESCRNFLAFEWGGVTYRSAVLFFGISNATHVCQGLMELACSNFRLQTHSDRPMCVVVYVDDFFIEKSLLALFKRKFETLNVEFNPKKERVGKILVYQGIVIDMETKRFRVSTAMQEKIKSIAPMSEDAGFDAEYDPFLKTCVYFLSLLPFF